MIVPSQPCTLPFLTLHWGASAKIPPTHHAWHRHTCACCRSRKASWNSQGPSFPGKFLLQLGSLSQIPRKFFILPSWCFYNTRNSYLFTTNMLFTSSLHSCELPKRRDFLPAVPCTDASFFKWFSSSPWVEEWYLTSVDNGVIHSTSLRHSFILRSWRIRKGSLRVVLTPDGIIRAAASLKVSGARGGQGFRHADPYPPGIQAHPGGQLFPSRLVWAGVRAAPKPAQTASRNVRLPRGTPWHLQNRTCSLSLLPAPAPTAAAHHFR